jgi:adenylyltransferase/sulfurtransferase
MESLRNQIAATEEHLRRLKEQLADLEEQNPSQIVQESDPVTHGKWPLSLEEYKRYGRQMIVPNIGIQGYIAPIF